MDLKEGEGEGGEGEGGEGEGGEGEEGEGKGGEKVEMPAKVEKTDCL